jgi:hypothetical protein
MRLVDDLFDMGGGYVLDFSDRTFAAFFVEELNIDITEERFYREGTSKAKRLRCFLQTVDKPTAVRTLKALWEYRKGMLLRSKRTDDVLNSEGQFIDLLNRINGVQVPSPTEQCVPPQPAFNREVVRQLKVELLAIAGMPPQARGYAYEKFLKKLFDVFGLEARQAFKLQGEQIDGSFQFGYETYLLEAKWQGNPTGAADLHVFQGKVGQKAAWARGLFISDSGFTPDGLAAFGRGKSIVCMSGLDLFDIMNREIPLNHVLERKVRHAAETGSPFIQVRDLFP